MRAVQAMSRVGVAGAIGRTLPATSSASGVEWDTAVCFSGLHFGHACYWCFLYSVIQAGGGPGGGGGIRAALAEAAAAFLSSMIFLHCIS